MKTQKTRGKKNPNSILSKRNRFHRVQGEVESRQSQTGAAIDVLESSATAAFPRCGWETAGDPWNIGPSNAVSPNLFELPGELGMGRRNFWAAN